MKSLPDQVLKLANIKYLVDQAPQFTKALDQAPTLFYQWCTDCGEWGHVPPMITFFNGQKRHFSKFLEIKKGSIDKLLILFNGSKYVKR